MTTFNTAFNESLEELAGIIEITNDLGTQYQTDEERRAYREEQDVVLADIAETVASQEQWESDVKEAKRLAEELEGVQKNAQDALDRIDQRQKRTSKLADEALEKYMIV